MIKVYDAFKYHPPDLASHKTPFYLCGSLYSLPSLSRIVVARLESLHSCIGREPYGTILCSDLWKAKRALRPTVTVIAYVLYLVLTAKLAVLCLIKALRTFRLV
jgi:hypothetical protein